MRVWLIADAATREVSYLRHGKEGDEPNWKQIGPFIYTSQEEAAAACSDPKFLPVGVTGSFTPLEVDTVSLIRAVYNGFPPVHPDVFVLDSVLLPLTAGGGAWIDDASENPVWTPLFDEGGSHAGLDWLDRVLGVVAARVGMTMETVQTIGMVNADEEDAAEVDQTKSLVKQHIRLSVIPEPGTCQLGGTRSGIHQLTPAAQFWVRTQGLVKLGLPELELRHVPVRWVMAAGNELLHWAGVALDHGIEEGDILQGGGPVPFTLQTQDSPDPFWEGHATGCLRLEVANVVLQDEVPLKSDEWTH